MIILILIINFLFSQEQIDPSKFYCKSNYELKILKLNNNNLIFYGSEGGIIRVGDNGEKWEQNYSGTHEKILKLIENKNKIYGITETGNFMYSEDYGDYWKYKKIGNILTDITILNDKIYISSNNDSIYISENLGISWETRKQNHVKNIKNIVTVSNKLIIFGFNQNNKLFVVDEDLSFLDELITPINVNELLNKNSEIYIKDNNKIAKLKSDLTWETYKIFDEYKDFKFYPYDDEIAIFVSNLSEKYNPKIEYYKLSINNNKTEYINSYSNNKMNVISFFNTEFETIDIERLNNEFILSNYNKTILKIDANNKWELVSTASKGSPRYYIQNYDNIVYNSGFGVVVASNYGSTFQFKPLPVIDSYGDSIRTSLDQIQFINNQNSLIILSDIGYKTDNLSKTNPYRIAITKDNFNSIKQINYLFSPPFLNANSNVNCLGKINNTPIINKTYTKLAVKPDSNGILKEANYYNCLYKLNFENEYIDSINTIIDSIQFPQMYIEEGKIWIYGINSISRKNAKIYLSINNGLTFNLVGDIDLSIDNKSYPHQTSTPILRRSKKGTLFLISELIIAKINEFDFSYNKIINSGYKLFDGISNSTDGCLEDHIFIIEEVADNSTKNNVYSKLEINNNIVKINKLFTMNNLLDLYYSESQESFVLSQSVEAKYKRLYFPIESDRLNYYSSVEDLEPPAIWTYPPYPNPVNGKVKMKFYSAIMNELGKLKVELVEISTGKRYEINKYNLSAPSDYWGEIEFDLTNFNRGAYLLNFKICNTNRSESIIIE